MTFCSFIYEKKNHLNNLNTHAVFDENTFIYVYGSAFNFKNRIGYRGMKLEIMTD